MSVIEEVAGSQSGNISAGAFLFWFFLLETLHYVAGLLGCLLVPGEIPKNYFPVSVWDSAGVRYIVRGVLFPFYALSAVSTASVFVDILRNKLSLETLKIVCNQFLVFFFLLGVLDVYSYFKEGKFWTTSKFADCFVHFLLLSLYLYTRVYEVKETRMTF